MRLLWIVLGTTVALAGCSSPAPNRVVLYCAQDREFAEAVLAEFSKTMGMPVAPKYDTEAAKSVGLFRELQLEAKRPRCDVHWNNEILTTLVLQKQGLLEPYDSPAAAAYPAWAKAADHTWYAFAERARVLLVNTRLVPEADRPKRLFDLADPKWKDRVGMAKPLFGTTMTQTACLFEVVGPGAAKGFYRKLKANGVKIVAGNKQVAEGVGRGDFAVGLTDTDDAIAEVEAGRPVQIIFPDSGGGTKEFPRLGTLFIPNTLAVVKGGPNAAGGRKLVDFLLSPEIERRLAESESRQFPVNPQVRVKLPDALEPGRTAKRMNVDFSKAAAMWDEVQEFLRGEFAR